MNLPKTGDIFLLSAKCYTSFINSTLYYSIFLAIQDLVTVLLQQTFPRNYIKKKNGVLLSGSCLAQAGLSLRKKEEKK